MTTWATAASQVIRVPSGYRDAAIDGAAAARLLGCGTDALAELAATPLATRGPDGAARFDYHDIMNLGLLSGTGKSLAELGERHCTRFAAEPAAKWLAPRTWRLRIEASCACGTPLRVPEPAAPGDGMRRDDRDGVTAVELTVRLAGRAGQVRAPRIRELYHEMLGGFRSGRYRFAWLPRGLREDFDAALANRTMDCVVSSTLLCRQATAAGFEARTRKGFLLGVVGVEHAWAEIREDGAWLPADPLLAYLAGRSASARPEFDGFCLGSLSSYVLPWDRPAIEPLADHDRTGRQCPAGHQPALTCRQLPQGG
jgi:transglutaminase superfamily protein